jgi:hypothetical protein
LELLSLFSENCVLSEFDGVCGAVLVSCTGVKVFQPLESFDLFSFLGDFKSQKSKSKNHNFFHENW